MSAPVGRATATTRALGDRAVAVVAAAGTALRAGALRGRAVAANAVRRLARGGASLRLRLRAARRRVVAVLYSGAIVFASSLSTGVSAVVGALTSAVSAVAGRLCDAGSDCRRYGMATCALTAAIFAFTRATVRARALGTWRRVFGYGSAAAAAGARGARGVVAAASAFGGGVAAMVDKVTSLGTGLKDAVPLPK